MPHIWIINHYADSPGGSSGVRHYSLSAGLSKCHWSSTIIASNIDHSSGKERGPLKERTRSEQSGGVSFLWIKGSEYSSNGLARIVNMVTFFGRLLLPSTTRSLPQPDVILGSTVHPLAALAGLLLANRKKIPFVYEIRDLWPQTLIDMGRIKEKSVFAKLLGLLENYLYNHADLVVTLLPKVDQYFRARGLETEKLLWISNGVDLDSFAYTETKTPASDEFALMYIGSHGEANCLHTLLNAYQKFTVRQSKENAITTRLIMIGSGNLKSELQAYAANLSLPGGSIEFRDPVQKSAVSEIAQSADAFVVTVRDLPELYRFGISMNKLFDYMAAARPVLLSSSAANNPIADAACGLSSPAEDEEALAENLRILVTMPESERLRMGLSGRDYVERYFSYSALSAKLAAELNLLTGGVAASSRGPEQR